MNAAQVIRQLGFELSVVDSDKVQISPVELLDDELKRWIIRNKPALIRDIHAADEVEISSVENASGGNSVTAPNQRTWN